VRESIVRSLIDCRLAVKSTTNITRAQRFLTAGAKGMPLPAYYAYARAHTLRWGGGDKRNMQNLKRGGALREAIEAPKGHNLCVVDSGQIEARTNGWLWGQEDLLHAFRDADAGRGRDAYCLMGDTIYGRPITKADATERFVGKVAVLGLGFQMGAAKLQLTLAKGALGGPPVFFTLGQCNDIVNKYRNRNRFIEAGWTRCKHIIEDMALGRTGEHGPLRWEFEKIHLPNGLTLKYPNLKKAMGDKGWEEWTYQAGAVRKKIYGGLLCENIVQCLARIIVGTQMLAINRKYRVVMTTHDECVSCVKTAQAPKAFDYMVTCFRTPPAWCSDIPLNAEGGFAFNYSK
jgi:DNA polymerase